VVSKPETELGSALDRLIVAGLLFRQGVPPQATYLFKHALVRDAAYGTLLREARRSLHARIAEALEIQSVEIAETQPELLARHCTEAGLIEKAAVLWGKAGLRSLARSALAEADAQLDRALAEMAALPGAPALRREQIKLQLALANVLTHLKGFATSDTMAAVDRARALIETSEALGEPPEDPLMLFSVLYGVWAASRVAFNGDAMRKLVTQFLTLAAKQNAAVPLINGHRVMGISLVLTGGISEGAAHLDQATALYDATEHRPLAMRFGADVGISILSYRSLARWLLGYPDGALVDTGQMLHAAREIGQSATTMFALQHAPLIHLLCGNHTAANAEAKELVALADEKGALYWKALGISIQGCLFALTGKASDAVQMITSGSAAYRSTGATWFAPTYLSHLARAHADIGQFDDALRCLSEATTAIDTTGERWFEAEVCRTAGEITRKSPQADTAKAEFYFDRALAVAREQQAKSWELRAAMSLAHLCRDQGKVQQAREPLASVYGWFTEGFETRDLKEAKALLEGWHSPTANFRKWPQVRRAGMSAFAPLLG
jgi:predicted ATPase